MLSKLLKFRRPLSAFLENKDFPGYPQCLPVFQFLLVFLISIR